MSFLPLLRFLIANAFFIISFKFYFYLYVEHIFLQYQSNINCWYRYSGTPCLDRKGVLSIAVHGLVWLVVFQSVLLQLFLRRYSLPTTAATDLPLSSHPTSKGQKNDMDKTIVNRIICIIVWQCFIIHDPIT